MLRIDQTIENGVAKVVLSGTIGESQDLKIEPGAATEVHVFCKDISRINSVGIKNWLLAFSALRERQIKLRFFELPPAIVSQCNFIKGLVNPGEAETVFVPYYCEHCNSELDQLFSTHELAEKSWNVVDLPCPTCKSAMQADVRPSDYFQFLQPKNRG